MQSGDIVYIKGGTFNEMDPGNPGWDTILILDEELAATGTSDRPIAYMDIRSSLLFLLIQRRGAEFFCIHRDSLASITCLQFNVHTIIKPNACDRHRTPHRRQLFARRCI